LSRGEALEREFGLIEAKQGYREPIEIAGKLAGMGRGAGFRRSPEAA
jgi:hypothetical protein